MATILIAPIYVKTVGGYDATITGLSVPDSDCIVGTVNGLSARWDIAGTCRDKTSDCNIDMNTDELQDLVQTANTINQG